MLSFDGHLNNWAETHVSALWWNNRNAFGVANAQMYNRFHGSWLDNGDKLPLDEANIVLGNFSQSPVYFKLGRQYVDFGWYDKNDTVSSMTHLFLEVHMMR